MGVEQTSANLVIDDHATVDEEDPLEAELSRDAEDYVSVVANDDFADERMRAGSDQAAAAREDNVTDHRRNNGGPQQQHGSSVVQATFNFINCIVGAGAIGLGGAIADSGGLISIASVICFAYLVKLSLDMLIDTSIRHGCSSYEDLGDAAFGRWGRKLVMTAKLAYAFGCLVAYTVVVKDNLGPALADLFPQLCSSLARIPAIVTWSVSTGIILPLCLLRDMTPLAGASIVSIACMVSIIVIVAWLWLIGQELPDTDNGNSSNTSTKAQTVAQELYQHWLVVHATPYLNNVGTFLFAFVCHHTVHLVFHSMRPEIRTLRNWKKVSSRSLSVSCLISLAVGVLVYMTFWEKTESDIFQVYPPTMVLDLAKLLLCASMLLTFPLPFFTCRELLAWVLFSNSDDDEDDASGPLRTVSNDRTVVEPLLRNESVIDNEQSEERIGYVSLAEAAGLPANQSELSIIQHEDERSASRSLHAFSWGQHVGLTVGIWFAATALGVGAPNLGDVLALVGCLCGTLIAFIIPAAVDMKLSGCTSLNVGILSVGLVVGTLGTICSAKQFIDDI
jgi:amino acid permease